MKKFQNLGTSLNREQSKKIKGGCFGCKEVGGGGNNTCYNTCPNGKK
ncbi:MAG: hypothetical protein K2X48_01990 [Chitinophagaceae bacterium]|nr:hypothetical protein [Chitinophagaceae bacterium]